MSATRAICAAAALASACAAAHGGDGATAAKSAFFPPGAVAQCVVDGSAIESFPTVAALKDKFGGNAALAEKTLDSSLIGKISFYAFAVVRMDGEGADAENDDGEDWYGSHDVVFYVGLSENVTYDEFRGAMLEMLSKRTDGGKPVEYKAEELAGNGLRFTLPGVEAEEDGGEGGKTGGKTEEFCMFPASPSLVLVAHNEATARGVADVIRKGLAVPPASPPGNPLMWLSVAMSPKDLFGDGEDDDGDSPLDGMEFLYDLTNVVAVADGNKDTGAIQLSLAGHFANSGSAAAASGVLSAFLRMAAFSGDSSNLLVSLGRRATIGADGEVCRVTAVFTKDEIEDFFATNAVETEIR